MSGETELNVSGWTVDTVHSALLRLNAEADRRHEQAVAALDRLLNQRMDLSDMAVAAALAAAEKAVSTAEVNAQRWREQANEWRTAMNDRERNFAGKDTVDTMFQSLGAIVQANREGVIAETGRNSERITAIEQNKIGGRATWEAILPVVSILIALAVAIVVIVRG